MASLGLSVDLSEVIRRWLGRKSVSQSHWSELQQWAEDRGFDMRRVRGHEGFAIEGRQGSLPWRMEWGPAQRAYIKGPELRIRAEAGLAPELQATLMNARLRTQLEREAFDPAAVSGQGPSGVPIPPEARWLISYEPLVDHELRERAGRWAAVSNVKPWAMRWLTGPLGQALDTLDCHPDLPVVVLIARGRCSLRVAVGHPHLGAIESWLRLFETCVREAQRTGHAGCVSENQEVTQPGMFIPDLNEREHVSLS
jgi:hypothetical protein